MPKKPKLPAYRYELPCVIVAVDQARRSGWAVFVEGKPVRWGEVDAADVPAIEAILTAACEQATKYKLPVVVLGEEHGQHSFKGRAKAGLGAAWGSWSYACERLNGRGLPIVMTRVMKVNTKVWRARFGMAALRKEHTKAYAVRRVAEELRIELPENQHDAAEALLIGLWGARAHVVGAKLPKRLMATWAAERADAAYLARGKTSQGVA